MKLDSEPEVSAHGKEAHAQLGACISNSCNGLRPGFSSLHILGSYTLCIGEESSEPDFGSYRTRTVVCIRTFCLTTINVVLVDLLGYKIWKLCLRSGYALRIYVSEAYLTKKQARYSPARTMSSSSAMKIVLGLANV